VTRIDGPSVSTTTERAPVPPAVPGAPRIPARVGRRRSSTRAGVPTRLTLNLIAVVVFVLSIFPVYWMVLTALTPSADIGASSDSGRPRLLPWPISWEHFDQAVNKQDPPITDFIWNSLIVSGATVVLAMFVAFLAATAVARFRFSGRAVYLILLMAVQMIPLEALIIPMYLVLRDADALNRLPSLVAMYLAFVLPFSIWTLRSFIQAVPADLEEAAMIDGCSRMGAFWRVLFPLIAPGLVATSIFAFIQAWNEYIFCLVVMGEGNYTLPVWLGSFTGKEGTDWGGVMAGSTFFTIPVVILFILIQKRITTGLASGAVKG
jgi:N,N'-diacetylchitobiose transport system permease protein